MGECTNVAAIDSGDERRGTRAPPFQARAQTNAQLYRQLLDAGYAVGDVRAVRDAYSLATKLFAGQLRPEGRPFVCHLIGVASILAIAGEDKTVIIGGLLHSAYTHGDFGWGRAEVTDAARASVRGAVGVPTERLLACYAMHPFNALTVGEWLANASTLEPDVRQVAVIRLADAIEDAQDGALQLSSKASHGNRNIPVEQLVALADALGHPRFAAALHQLLANPTSEPCFDALREPHAGSYFVCPPSWRERLWPRVRRWTRHVLRAR